MISMWIEERRKILNLTHEELAEMVGVSTDTVREWGEGLSMPPFESLAGLAERLGDPNHPPGLLSTSPLELGPGGTPLVITDNLSGGIAHLLAVGGKDASVLYFDGPEKSIRKEEVPLSRLRAVRLSPQTRVFVRDDNSDRWHIGRTRVYDEEKAQYTVEFPDGMHRQVAEREIHVRSGAIPCDPLGVLACKAHETGFFHAARLPLVKALVDHRRRTRGMSALASSRIDLLPHQIGVVHRVINDPVSRYLLADEVGLGKTIEAGVLARQHLIDHPDGNVLILVPAGLVGQWKNEWHRRFALYPYDPRFEVVAYEEISRNFTPTFLIIDEAHHVAAWAWSDRNDERESWASVSAFAEAASGVLLLSATPAATDTDVYLAMLHLLDPEAYLLEDRVTFADRVQLQSELGKKLLALDENAPGFLLEQPARDLRDLLADDPEVVRQVEELLGGLEGSQQVVTDAVRRLRTWISETYRLHRRLLRNRREEVNATPLGRSEENLREEWGLDSRVTEVFDAIEQWRLDAVAGDDSGAYAGVYRVFIETAVTDLGLVATVAKNRLGGMPAPDDLMDADVRALAVPLFNREREALEAIIEAALQPLSDDDVDQVGLLVEALRRPIRNQSNTVVFVSYPGIASSLVERLAEEYGHEKIMSRLEGMEKASLDEEIGRFLATRGGVLVCDRSGEEGVNLQQADNAILFDLPFAPNRLEQRLGRLDRIGRKEDLVVWVMPGPESVNEEPTPIEAWLEMLRRGFGIFHQSAAPLQFFIAEIVPKLIDTLYRMGPQGLLQSVENVQQAVIEEERRVAAQDLVDGSSLRTESEKLMADLVDDEEHTTVYAKTVGWWLEGVLNFNSLNVKGGKVYRPTERTLLPADVLLNRFLPLSIRPTTFNREFVLGVNGPELARSGHPLVDQVVASMEWDDRGRAAAFAREASGMPVDSAWWGFRLDWIVETDLSAAYEVLGRHNIVDSAARVALRRRADIFYPPHVVRSVVDADGVPVVDGVMCDKVLAPFSKVTDRNLHKERIEELDTYIPPHQWRDAVMGAGESSAASIRESDDIKQRIAAAQSRVEREYAERIPILRARVIRDNNPETVRFEEELLAALSEGVGNPALSLEAVAFVALESGRAN